jgi:hypothetical protein
MPTEFGVAKGHTAHLMLDLLPQSAKLHLFDFFAGLPNDWIGPFKQGHFALDEASIAAFDDPRVVLNRGLFLETVPGYFNERSPLSFVHIDCDLYESTWQVLDGITPALQPGTIIVLDDYFFTSEGETSTDEHRTFLDWTRVTGVRCRYLWKTTWCQVAVEVRAT